MARAETSHILSEQSAWERVAALLIDPRDRRLERSWFPWLDRRGAMDADRSPSSLGCFTPGQPVMARLKTLQPGHVLFLRCGKRLRTEENRERTQRALLEVLEFCHGLLSQGWGARLNSPEEVAAYERRFPPELLDFVRAEWAERGAQFLASRGVRFATFLRDGRPVFWILPGEESFLNRLAMRASEEDKVSHVFFDPEATVLTHRAGAGVTDSPRTLYLGVQELEEDTQAPWVIEHERDHLRRFFRRDCGEEDPSFGLLLAHEESASPTGGLPRLDPVYARASNIDEPEAYLVSLREWLNARLDRRPHEEATSGSGASSDRSAEVEPRTFVAHILALAARNHRAASLTLRALRRDRRSKEPLDWAPSVVAQTSTSPARIDAEATVPWGTRSFRLRVPLQRSSGPEDPDNTLLLCSQLRGLVDRSRQLAGFGFLAQKVLSSLVDQPEALKDDAFSALRTVLETLEIDRTDAGRRHEKSYQRLVAIYNRALLEGSVRAFGVKTMTRRPGILTQIAARAVDRRPWDAPSIQATP